MSNANIAEIVELYGDVTKNGRSKLFDNSDFGYRQITVERPLRLAFQVTPERIAVLKEEGAFQKLATSKKKGKDGQREIEEGQALQQEIVSMLEGLAEPQADSNRPDFEKRLAKATARRHRALESTFAEGESEHYVRTARGRRDVPGRRREPGAGHGIA